MNDPLAIKFFEPLSQRETEILGLISEGLSNREIAERLFLSVDTVKWYNKQLFSKLGVSSRTHAVSLARRYSLLEGSRVSPHKKPNTPHNLPLQLTSFYGRERDIAELMQLLSWGDAPKQVATKRLVIITGPGGMGKTRLAIQVAKRLLSSYPDGVWRVDLASISDPELVPQTLATVLQLREQVGLSIASKLIEHLQDKRCLLILDNCEHLIHACAQLTDTLLQVCPGVVILVTSRETLGIMGEYTYRLSGLPVPIPHQITSVNAIIEQESIQLFVDRARFVLPGFQVTVENAPALAQISLQLEGMPLAIELAAARVEFLTVEQIAARLEDVFRLLSGSKRTAHPHQQTLFATIDWSYNLLSDEERILLRRLSVFAAGWTLETAEAIVGDDAELLTQDILNSMSSLVKKSLVITEWELKAETRYRILDTIRQYASQKLYETGEFEIIHARHCEFMLKLVERAGPDLSRGEYLPGWENRLELEHDNLRSALEWSLKNERVDTAMLIAVYLFDFWFDRNYFQEGRKWYDAGLMRRDRLPEVLLAQVLFCAGRFSARQGDLELAERYGSESVRILNEVGDKNNLATALRGLSSTVFERGDIETARQMDLKMLELYQIVGNKPGIAMALAYIGWDEVYLGEVQKGLQRLEKSLETQREIGNIYGIAFSAMALGICLFLQAEINPAEAMLCEALSQFNDLKNKTFMCNCLEGLAGVATARHQAERAATLMGISNKLMETTGLVGSPDWERRVRTEILSLIHQQLDENTFSVAFTNGRSLADGNLDDVVAYALDSGA